VILPVILTLLPAAAFSCSIVAASASRVKSNRPVTLPKAKVERGEEDDADDDDPLKGEKDLLKEDGPDSASLYVVKPGPPTTLVATMLPMYVEIPAPPEREAERGSASR
jgi:hypothetical protein